MILSAGSLGPPVLIIADDNMEPDSIDVKEINGLGIRKESNPVGCLVFSKSLAPCHQCYEWMLGSMTVPYI